jgi:hypothetical protein
LRAELEYATTSVPLPSARRLRAIASAERALNGGLRRHFHLAFPPTSPESAQREGGAT